MKFIPLQSMPSHSYCPSFSSLAFSIIIELVIEITLSGSPLPLKFQASNQLLLSRCRGVMHVNSAPCPSLMILIDGFIFVGSMKLELITIQFGMF